MAASQESLVYQTTLVDGVPFRPDSRELMKQAIAGRRIDVLSGNDYINLYHVFERLQASDKDVAEHTLIRRRIGPSRWALFVVPPGKDAPEAELETGYDPKRGRYMRYADQLRAGEILTFTDRAEAVKARRAWQLYVPKAKRRKLRPAVRKKRGGGFVVLIVKRRG